ncbi:SMP-30/gluconolactonase/LRE family protein [Sphingomonas silueang]|uniref:SMP-30/gluconolactonase/LRE family protein n=1 Tax=Sphingomonas silueang TaxID=3156617 RepID=UPI0032B5C0B7
MEHRRYRRYVGGALVAAAAFVAAGAAAQSPTAAIAPAVTAEVPALTKAQVDALLATPGDVLFLDVRRADEISAIGSVPAFLNIQASELDRFLAVIPRDRRIVPVSNHAGRARRAAALLAAKGFTVAGVLGIEDYAAAGGQVSGRRFVTPAIPGVVAADTRVEVVREGFDGTEGPVRWTDGSILFTENRADRIVRIAPDHAVSTYLDKTGAANALAVSAAGDLIAVQTAQPAVAVLKPRAKQLASAFGKVPFNRPNDLAAARRGDIYFTDPGAAPQPGAPPVKTALYWLDPRGRVARVADDIARPNGVALSPDETTLYVADSYGDTLLAYPLARDGTPGTRRAFARLAGYRQTPAGPRSGADGIAVDAEGRVFVATSAGVEVFGADGAALGILPIPNAPQNLAFGGADRSKLYVVGRGSVYRIATLTRGVDRPGK